MKHTATLALSLILLAGSSTLGGCATQDPDAVTGNDRDKTMENRFREEIQESRAEGEIPGQSHSRYPQYADEEQVKTLTELTGGKTMRYYMNAFEDLRYDVVNMDVVNNTVRMDLSNRDDERYQVVLKKDAEGMVQKVKVSPYTAVSAESPEITEDLAALRELKPGKAPEAYFSTLDEMGDVVDYNFYRNESVFYVNMDGYQYQLNMTRGPEETVTDINIGAKVWQLQ